MDNKSVNYSTEELIEENNRLLNKLNFAENMIEKYRNILDNCNCDENINDKNAINSLGNQYNRVFIQKETIGSNSQRKSEFMNKNINLTENGLKRDKSMDVMITFCDKCVGTDREDVKTIDISKVYEIKNNCNQEPEVYRRDSFEDRICDDLCSLVLSYLSFENKIRYECISKQFQKCIYKYQKEFTIDDHLNNLIGLKVKIKSCNITTHIINLKLLRSILIKCKSISRVRIQMSTHFNKVIDMKKKENSVQVLQLIIKYCNYLKEIYYDFDEIDVQVIESFGKKFGRSLETIGFSLNKDSNRSSLIKLCPNLITIKNARIKDIIDTNDFKLLVKLNNFEIQYKRTDNELFETFFSNYKMQIKSIKTTNVFTDSHKDQKFIKYLSEFKNLKKLDLFHSTFITNSPKLLESIKSIGTDCKKLTFLRLHFYHISYELFLTFSYFENLRTLSLEYGSDDIENQLSCSHLKSCKHLTEFILKGKFIRDSFFIDIHKHLPKLKILKLIDNSDGITAKTLSSISNLLNISQIFIDRLHSSNESIDKEFNQIINNCRQIELIQINDEINISEVSIDNIKSLALSKPKTRFKFILKVKENVTNFWRAIYKKPNNLSLIFDFHH